MAVIMNPNYKQFTNMHSIKMEHYERIHQLLMSPDLVWSLNFADDCVITIIAQLIENILNKTIKISEQEKNQLSVYKDVLRNFILASDKKKSLLENSQFLPLLAPIFFRSRHYRKKIPSIGKQPCPSKRCRVCYKNGLRKETRYCCQKCDGLPGLCSLKCFLKWHDYKQK